MEYNQNVPKEKFAVWSWGHKRLPAQKGVVSYQIAPNRVSQETILYNKGGVFNMIRRSRNQFLYVVPPFVAAYFLMSWAEERNHYLNSKEGRALFGDDAE